jgi:GNAT superfamily N-acetyltransferase
LLRSQGNTVQNSNSAHPNPSQASKDAGHKTLRRATTADAVAVRELTRAAYAKWVPVLGREPRPMTADYDAALRDHLIDLLLVDGEAAALIEMAPKADHLLIVNVAVAPTYQGKGYGRALMAHAEEVARSLSLNEMRLYTNALFAENLRLYSRLGYRVDREEQHPQFGVTVYMSKRFVAATDELSNSRTSP